MKTFAELKDEIRRLIWPTGEARSLVASHNVSFIDVMIDLQRTVECLRVRNTSQYPHCSTYWHDAKTAVEAPKGRIHLVYTIANGNWRDKVYMDPCRWPEMLVWANQLYKSLTPVNAGLPALPTGHFYAEPSTDSTLGRARVGLWTQERGRIYVAPWIQSNETLVIEWDGIKSAWGDTDAIDEDVWDQDVRGAIQLYVRWDHERKHGTDMQMRQAAKLDYEEKRADLMLDCQQRIEEPQNRNPEMVRRITQAELTAGNVPAAATTTFSIGMIGDWGSNDGTASAQTAALVEILKVRGISRVFTLGDNVYDNDAAVALATLLAPLHDFTTTYSYGNHDYDRGIAAITAYIPQNGNGRYFSVVYGNVHFFVLSTDPRETDGGYVDASTSTENSIMGEWLRTSLAISTARWKVVIGHHTPYTSDVNNYPGNRWMRWPFKTWGADLYLCGHGHSAELVTIDGFNYLQNGLGGNSIRDLHSPRVTGSVWSYNSDYAVSILTATCDTLKIDIRNQADVVVETFQLTK